MSAAIGTIVLVLTPPKSITTTAAKICSLRPALRDFCGGLGVPGVPTKAEGSQWALAKDDCNALRKYLSDYPDGVFAAQADRRWVRRTIEISDAWEQRDEPALRDYASFDDAFATRDAAMADAFRRGQQEARAACPVDGARRRTLGAVVSNAQPRCRQTSTGYVCALDFEVVCHVEVRDIVEVCR